MVAELERRRRLAVLGGVMCSVFLAAMESTVVATAMPTVIASLGGIRIYSWVFSAFLLTSTVTIPLWGRLSDQLGRRRTYLVGLGLFLLGSALSGLSQSMAQLIAFRAIQGLGAGSLISVGVTIIADLYGLERRAKMQGYFSSVWGVASIVGPLLGGVLADTWSWRWAFYINLPFGLLASAGIAWGLRHEPVVRRRVSIDYRGMAVFTAAVSVLLMGLVEGGREASWSGGWVLGLLAAAAVLTALFVLVERRVAEPVVPLALFANPMVRAAAATGFFAGMAMFGAIAYVPLFLQSVVGSTATQAGFVLTPFVLSWVLFSVVGARLVLRAGYRGVVIAGMCILTTAFLLLSGWGPPLTRFTAARDMLLAGVGMGLVFVPMLIAVQNAVPHAILGSATSMTMFFRAIGGAVGVAVMGSVMAHRLHTELGAVASATAGPLLESIRELARHPDLIVNPLTRGAIPPEVLAPVRLALAHSLSGVFLVGLLVCVAALTSAFLVPSGQARDLVAEPPAPTREGAAPTGR
ncbi:MAG: MFS transporter [Candidatus Rokubacteria bacterium]|nr:MFS transporter [Candidatus Rokubacteria bacterium]